MTQTSEHIAAIESEISNIVVELYDTISLYHENKDINAVHKYIGNYIRSVTRISFRLAKLNMAALRDSCVIFHDILEHINNKNTLITIDQFQQFEVWPTLIITCLESPDNNDNVENLIEFLEDPLWNHHIDNNSFKFLREEFNNSNNSNLQPEKTLDDVTETTFDGSLFESIQEEVIDAMTALISDLASIEEGDDDFGLSNAFYLCADRIRALGLSVSTVGLLGLMDVCMIFQSGLRELACRDEPLSEEEQIIIEEWTAYFIAYLYNPSNQSNVNKLVDYLSIIPWYEYMSDDEMAMLKIMLIPEDIEVSAPVESNENTVSKQNLDVEVNENEELDYEMENSEGLDDVSISEEMYFLGAELIRLIHDEFQLEQVLLDEAIRDVKANIELTEQDIEQLSKYNVMIERFSIATESIGLTGLNKILVFLAENLDCIVNKQDDKKLTDDIVNALKLFSDLALKYLSDMDNTELIHQLISLFYSSNWPVKFKHNKDSLEKELLSPRLLIEDDIEIRATQATNEDISLKLPEDVNQQLLTTLLQELPIQTADFTEAITVIVEGNASLKDVERAQRIAHTLKGAANTVGIAGIATLTHHIEDIFDAFASHQRMPGKNLSNILMDAADVLEMMSESLLGSGDAPDQAQSVLQQILDWANLIDQEGIPEDDAQIKITQISKGDDSKSDTSHLNQIEDTAMLRVPATLMDELLRLAGESIILGGQVQERLRNATDQTLRVHEQNLLYRQLVFDLEQIVDVQGLSSNKTDTKSDSVFDTLELEQYNELHTVTQRLVEASTDSKELTNNIEDELNALDTLLVEQSRLQKNNQNIVMQTRMIPVQSIIPRLQRIIRQTSRATSKKVALNVDGVGTLMDSDVLNELIDPLMHILRNSIDHGIESETDRNKKGKNITGKIDLSFYRDGDHIVVRCVDDGAGLDFDAIRKTAIKKELIAEENSLTESDLIRLIWFAGFTTRDTTTQVSGRGIGMDVVYNKITSLKGTININSEKDVGCTVELRLPLTLISVHAIIVKQRNQTVAISNRSIEHILCSGDGEFKRNNDKYTYHLNDDVYNAFDIETLLHQPYDKNDNDIDSRTVFIVRDDTGNQYAVSVEHVIANQDLIVKQLGTYIPNIIGIEGATILGDGSVAPVLDLPGLIKSVSDNKNNSFIERTIIESEYIEDSILTLIVDDSLSARRSLAEFIKDIGYDVCMARDGIEALEVIEEKIPDIILVDLEMPRMNGLELTTHLRSKSKTKDIPVIMITSRSTEKHREMADAAGINTYLTKPFSEDELLESIQNLLLIVN